MKLSKKALEIPPSGIRVFFDMVLQMKDVISLGVGEPDFVTPWNIRESAIYSLEQGYTSYTSNKGMIELRREIAKHLWRKHKLEYDPEEEILITVGVSEAYDLAIRALINPGDKIIIPIPSYVAYGPIVTLQGGVPVYITTKHEGGFKITPKDIRKAVDKKTKALLLNYPSNPTGASYTKKELTAIANTAKELGLLVITDEVYGELTYDFKHTAFATLANTKDSTLYLDGFSKAYAMTGWRVGYACGPRDIIATMTKIHQYTIMCVSISSQIAAIEALRSADKSISEMKKEYRRRRAFIVSELNRIGLTCHKPQGAFYAFPSIRKYGLNCVDFASELLKKEKVAVVPGVAFDPTADYHVRMSYASSLENIKEALIRIERFLKTL